MHLRKAGTVLTSVAVASAAAVAFAAPSYAAAAATTVYVPTVASQIRPLEGQTVVSGPVGSFSTPATSVGTCNFVMVGPSTDPGSVPFEIEGQAVAATAALVASVELSCQLRSGATIWGTLTRNAPGYASAVAGPINVTQLGTFQLCTMVNVHYENGTESNPTEVFSCAPLDPLL